MPRSWRQTLKLFNAEIKDAETLPPHALRYLFKHSEVHLNVEWRDLPGAGWHAEGVDLSQGPTTVVDTVLLRAKTVWSGAIELGNGGRIADVPRDFLRAIDAHWHHQEPAEPATAQTGGRDAWLLGLTSQ
jgi:maleylpyruvate isomerase